MGGTRVLQTSVILLLIQLIFVFSNNFPRRPQQGYLPREVNPQGSETLEHQHQYNDARPPTFQEDPRSYHQNVRFPPQYFRKEDREQQGFFSRIAAASSAVMNSLELQESRIQYRPERPGRDYTTYNQMTSVPQTEYYAPRSPRGSQDFSRERFDYSPPSPHSEETERNALNSYFDPAAPYTTGGADGSSSMAAAQPDQWRERQYEDVSYMQQSTPYEREPPSQFQERFHDRSPPSQAHAFPPQSFSDASRSQSHHAAAPAPPPAAATATDPFENLSPDPQVFIHEDSVVMIAKPKDFEKKKFLMRQAGPQQIQLLADFEHVFTKFKNEQRVETFGSRDVVEMPEILSHEAFRQIQALYSDFNALERCETQDYEELFQKVQSIIIRQGNLHISHIAPITKASLPRLGLRDGWREALQALTISGVPSYLFSSGYGDIISNALLLGGLSSQPAAQTDAMFSSSLPQNLRIVSNFFRIAPDGSVRAFSQPILHEK